MITQEKIIERIRNASTNLEFREKRWQSVSEPAKQLLRGLLNVDPKKRMKLKDLARHEWIRNGGCCNGSANTSNSETTQAGTSNNGTWKIGGHHTKKGGGTTSCSQEVLIDLCEPSPAAVLNDTLIDGQCLQDLYICFFINSYTPLNS